MIAFYISSHGFGHLTRSMAIIDYLLEETNFKIYLVSGEKQISFAREYYKENDKLVFDICETDIGLINKKLSLEVDKEETFIKVEEFIEKSAKIIQEEVSKIKRHEIKLIISDITVLAFYIAKRADIYSIGISNFTWVDQYRNLRMDTRLLSFFNEGYKYCNLFFKYPLALGIQGKECNTQDISFLCRKIDYEKVKELKMKYGKIIFISLGKSASVDIIKVNSFKGTVIYTEGVEIECDAQQLKLSIDINDTQNYIAASELVVAKAGWGTVAECMISGAKMALIERKSVIEDTHIISELKKINRCISINEKELLNLDINSILKEFVEKKIINEKVDNDYYIIGKKIIELNNTNKQEV